MKELKEKKMNQSIPEEAVQVKEKICNLLSSQILCIYLYGSAIDGGLKAESDIDLLVLTNQTLSQEKRQELTEYLMQISGKIGNEENKRYLEVTIVNKQEMEPWHYPITCDYMYGEWLRETFEKGNFPEPTRDPECTLLLFQARKKSLVLYGESLPTILSNIPFEDIKKAMRDLLPELKRHLYEDERNVILTLCRMWFTASTQEIISKDKAAEWSLPHLPNEYRKVVELAKARYIGETVDDWIGLEDELASFALFMEKTIGSSLSI